MLLSAFVGVDHRHLIAVYDLVGLAGWTGGGGGDCAGLVEEALPVWVSHVPELRIF